MGNLFEFGSSVNIIMRVKTDIEIGGKQYKPGQIYTILRDCAVNFSYDVISTNINARQNIYQGDIKNNINSIEVGNVPINSKVANLIFGYNKRATFNKPIIEQIMVEDGIYYSKYPMNEQIIVTTLQGDSIDVDQYTYTTDELHIIDGEYILTYYTECSGTIYNLQADYFPYFTIELMGCGNTDKITKNIYMCFPSVTITQVPRIDLDNEGVCSIPFVFNVIEKGQDLPYIVFED